MDCFHNPYTLTLKVVRPGFEPRQTEPKTVVLPLYYRTMSLKSQRFRFSLFDDAKIEICFKNQNVNLKKSKPFYK
ncbi:MAG: hypothetical protein K0S31_2750 [Sphingobacterium multivorum]|nr:hypothetical protein [Sphingobacterium multivorum]